MRESNEPTTRRAALQAAGRWAGLAGLAALVLALNRKREPWNLARRGSPQDCTRRAHCRNCPMLDRCELPSARAARASEKR